MRGGKPPPLVSLWLGCFPDPSSLVGQGKLDEIVEGVTSTKASLVLFDHDLTPRNCATSNPGYPAM
jgi:hypothetical protein